MCTDKTCPFITGGNTLDQIKTRQIEPAVIVPVHVLVDQEHGTSDIGGLAEHHQELLITAVFDITAQDRKLPALLAALCVINNHPHLRTAIRAAVIGSKVGPRNDFIGVGQRLSGYSGRTKQSQS